VRWREQVAEYPDDVGVTYRELAGPVGAPDRDRPRTRMPHSPMPGCAACSDAEPCARHAEFDLIASVGGAR
jgi:hypothetical protein